MSVTETSNMITVQKVILFAWLIFMAYWFTSSTSVKPIRKTQGWLGGTGHNILLFLGFLLILASRPIILRVQATWLGTLLFPPSTLMNILAALLVVAGLIVAIIARKTLADNWSRSVAIKEGHELITTGLYNYIRNPIYTGILMMALGTVLSDIALSACVGFLIVVLVIFLKLRGEEKILPRNFSAQYLDYEQRTKALIPFVW